MKMVMIQDRFRLHRARSGLFSEYESGDVAYVGNGLVNNAVKGYVKPRPKDKVFRSWSIAISAFCEASVQSPPFIGCGRAGNGLVLLEPIEAMTCKDLTFIASYINAAVTWRFSWYRQVTADRIRRILIPEVTPDGIVLNVQGLVPRRVRVQGVRTIMTMKGVALGTLFDLRPGEYHNVSVLQPGTVPVVSCGGFNNGIIGSYDVDQYIHENRMTIAFNGSTLSAKYHPYRFAAKDDVAVCYPLTPLRLSSIVFCQTMVEREKWRFSYYRKCFVEKLRRLVIALPFRDDLLDEDGMCSVVSSSEYWDFVGRACERDRSVV